MKGDVAFFYRGDDGEYVSYFRSGGRRSPTTMCQSMKTRRGEVAFGLSARMASSLKTILS